MEELMNELYALSITEQNRSLTSTESNRYFEIFDILSKNGIDIVFPVAVKNQ